MLALAEGGLAAAGTARRLDDARAAAYRVAFGRPKAAVGLQPELLGSSRVWLLPNPSGLNAHYQLPDLVAAYGALRDAAFD